MEQELKVLLYRCYMLAFNEGYSSGSVCSAEESWEHNKYFFEDDIKRFDQNTRAGGWISVEERLPEMEVMVLTTGGEFTTTTLHVGDGIFLKNGPLRVNVTHWMPMPAPPEDK